MPRDDRYVSYIEALEEVSKRVNKTFAKRETVHEVRERVDEIETKTGRLREDVKDLRERVGDLEKGEVGGGSSGESSGSGSDYELPVATKTRLGGIKIGSGLKSTADGTVSVDVDLSKVESRLDSVESRVETLEGLSDGSGGSTTPVPGSGDKNVIEEIRVNGVKQEPSEKVVDITVPTKTGDLTNNSDFQTSADVLRMISEKVGEGGEINGILGITVNGVNQPAQDNVVNITVPTDTSQLTNGADYQTSEEVDVAIDEKLKANEQGFQTAEDVQSAISDKLSDIDGVITGIKVNGDLQEDDDGVVDIKIPKKIGDLENDQEYLSSSEIDNVIDEKLSEFTPVKKVSELENDLEFQTESQVSDAINSKVSSVYKPGGSLDAPDSSKLNEEHVGYVYDILSPFNTNTSDFVENVGSTYPAGTNIVVIKKEDGTFKFDVLSGFVDLSEYVKNSEISDIRTTVNKASSDASSAKTLATEAASDANSAKLNASSALETAENASSLATTANATANSASASATTAIEEASSAKSIAEDARDTADVASIAATIAKSTANDAATTANAAKSTATEAKATADGIAATANAAKSTAADAKSVADTAKTTATSAQTTANNNKNLIDQLTPKVFIPGGKNGQALIKASDNDYDIKWGGFVVNDNFLINSTWISKNNIVNQKGLNEYTENGYAIDTWYFSGLKSVKVNDDSITLTVEESSNAYGNFMTKIENAKYLNLKTVTASVLYKSSNDATLALYNSNNTYLAAITLDASEALTLREFMFTFDNTFSGEEMLVFRIYPSKIGVQAAGTIDLIAAKLEPGPVQTLAHKEEDKWVFNKIPDYGLELLKCQRYQYSIGVDIGKTLSTAVSNGNGTVYFPIYLPVFMQSSSATYSFSGKFRVCDSTGYKDVIPESNVYIRGNIATLAVSGLSKLTTYSLDSATGGRFIIDNNI